MSGIDEYIRIIGAQNLTRAGEAAFVAILNSYAAPGDANAKLTEDLANAKSNIADLCENMDRSTDEIKALIEERDTCLENMRLAKVPPESQIARGLVPAVATLVDHACDQAEELARVRASGESLLSALSLRDSRPLEFNATIAAFEAVLRGKEG